jgi:predicted permease
MNFLAKVRFYLRSLFQKRKMDQQLSEEIAAHVVMATEANIAKGMPPEEARDAALRELGNVASIQERTRDERGWVWLEQLGQDLRYAARQLARTPGFTAVVVLTLALGIGGTTAIFTMVDTVILHPVNDPERDRLMQIGQRLFIQGQESFPGVSQPVLEALSAQRDRFADLSWSFAVELERQTEEFANMEHGAYVSPEFFSTLRCQPIFGRGFLPEEAREMRFGEVPADTSIVLSHTWWQTQWGGDRGILGRAIKMGGRQYTVIGVMPPHFQFPEKQTQFWIPVQRMIYPPGNYPGPDIGMFVRLKPGVDSAQLLTWFDGVGRQLMNDYPETTAYGAAWRVAGGWNISIRPLGVALQDGGDWAQLRQTLLGLFAAMAFVLLIVCANVANLALARLEHRQHELAIRAAIGAGRGRLMRQLLVENLLLALLGGAAGLLVTAGALKVLVALNAMPRLRPIEIDGRLLGATLVISVLTALLFGLAPMWRAGHARVNALLGDRGLSVTGGRRSARYRNLLVMAQVALAVVLLTGAGLMLVSVSRVLKVDPGFDPQNLLLVETQLPWQKYDSEDAARSEGLRRTFIAECQDRFRALPGVVAVGVRERIGTQHFQFSGRRDSFMVEHASSGADQASYFQSMRIPLREGRDFTASDVAQPEKVIVNEVFARQFWPDKTALGEKLDGVGGQAGMEVTGVVNDMRIRGYLVPGLPTVYHPLGAKWFSSHRLPGRRLQFVIRSTKDPVPLISFVRHAIREAEPGLINPSFKVARQVLYDSTLAQRTYRNYLGLFAGLGSLLAALGIYGVLAFSVSRRTREIGIRVAIGADANEVRAMVLRQGARLIGAGVVAGLLASAGLTRFLQSQLFEVSATDPWIMGGATAVLAVVGLAACWLPARRAAKVNPVIALRAE